MPLRIVHVITSLQRGGAEAMLAKLVTTAAARDCSSLVVCLGSDGPSGDMIRTAGVQTLILGLSTIWPNPLLLAGLIRQLRRWRPDIIQGWMYHGNLAASLLGAVLPGNPRSMWNIRCSAAQIGEFPLSTRAIIRASALLSRRTQQIVFNSAVAVREHEALAFDVSRAIVLPNGFDVLRFRPCETHRLNVRASLELLPDQLVVGMAARYHPMKDFGNLFGAIRRLLPQFPGLRVLLAGPGVTQNNLRLTDEIRTASLSDSVILLGDVSKMEELLPALDVFCLSSAWGEGFPNVIGEAMACGVPCVGTRVGDVAEVIADCGGVVEPRDAVVLASALARMLSLTHAERKSLGGAARQRIVEMYELEKVVDRYLGLYRRVIA